MNVNKICSGCQKTVYPMEQFKCLDQYWHKTCFKCEVCKTTLTVKNYKGFEKKPYCHAHYPTVKHTPISDTPELKRVMENSKKVSQVEYHHAFEKSKGQKISVVDDPLSALQKKTQQNVSQVAYHNLKDKRHSMEARRSSVEVIKNQQEEANGADAPVPSSKLVSQQSVGDRASFYTRAAAGYTFTKPQSSSVVVTSQSKRFQPGRIEDYDPMNDEYGSVTRPVGSESRPPRPSSFQGDVVEETMPMGGLRSPVRHEAPPFSPPIPEHAAYVAPTSPPAPEPKRALQPVYKAEPEPQRPLEPVYEPEPQRPLDPVYEPEPQRPLEPVYEPEPQRPLEPVYEPEPQRPLEPVYEPEPEPERPSEPLYDEPEPDPEPYSPSKKVETVPMTDQIHISGEENGANVGLPDGVTFGRPPLYRAAYEYVSQDSDEVSFVEGDIISNGLPIDEGWMYGLVERTGAYGMMPSNYVTPL